MICLKPHADPNKMAKLNAINQTLQLPMCDDDNAMQLGWLEQADQADQLALFPKETGAVSIDFVGGKKNHRRQFGGGKNQPLPRAIGLTAQHIPTVLDATAGMAGDGFVLASLGCEVTLVERSAVISALIRDALQRGITTDNLDPGLLEILQRLTVINADSSDYLLSEKPQVDVIYMDPMYPEKKKKAAVKKEMQALQQLVGPDLDSFTLLKAALQTAQQRVVVKRPAKAPIIELENGITPSTSIQSPNTRYDVYVIKALKSSGKIE